MYKERYLRELLGETAFNELMEQKEIKELLAQGTIRKLDKNKIASLNPVPDVEIEYNPPKKIRCEYCGKTNRCENDECWRCGAPLPFIEPPSIISCPSPDSFFSEVHFVGGLSKKEVEEAIVDEFEMMNAMAGNSKDPAFAEWSQ